MKKKLAVIGSGIAGMACAYYLRDLFEVHLYESDGYIGGHTNTRFVSENREQVPIDTGFMVFNDHTYPNLVRLFDELGVTSYPTSMSFGVRNDTSGLEYCSKGASGFFAQRLRTLSPSHWKFLQEIKTFFRNALEETENKHANDYTLADFARDRGISPRVLENFVIPMAGAIWSTPPQGILDFPAIPLLRFMKNHRMLGIGTQYQWKTVEGGSEQYKQKLLAKLHNKPVPNLGVAGIQQTPDAATLTLCDGTRHDYYQVIVATHANDALALLENPSEQQSALLSCFRYNRNQAVLHTDESVMPKSRHAWSSWNVAQTGDPENLRFSTHYWMNSLQQLDTDKNYFVSIDSYQEIEPDKIHWQKEYTHPLFDTQAINAQSKLSQLNKSGPLSFCGSYHRNGFHEDAIWSALNVVAQLKTREERACELLPL